MTELEKVKEGNYPSFDREHLELIKKNYAKGATDEEFKIFIHQCKKSGLDPVAKQIYFIKFGDKLSIFSSIDGRRLTAHRTKQYLGEETHFEYRGNDPAPKNLVAAVVKVRKKVGSDVAVFTGYARLDEYMPKGRNPGQWAEKPHTMLAKVAESIALRKAFPAELSGIYEEEEFTEEKPEEKEEPQRLEITVHASKEASPPEEVSFSPISTSTLPVQKPPFDPKEEAHIRGLKKMLHQRGFDDDWDKHKDFYDRVIKALTGRPSTDLDKVLDELTDEDFK